jgi:hypothetical protein
MVVSVPAINTPSPKVVSTAVEKLTSPMATRSLLPASFFVKLKLDVAGMLAGVAEDVVPDPGVLLIAAPRPIADTTVVKPDASVPTVLSAATARACIAPATSGGESVPVGYGQL